jgi:hypothetical protein
VGRHCLAELDLAAMSLPHEFDFVVSAGNVMTFLESTWDLRPFTPSSEVLVAVVAR